MNNLNLKQLVTKYILWKKERNEDTQYDEIDEFVNQLSRGDLVLLMEFVQKNIL